MTITRLKNGQDVAILATDTHISKWVVDHGRLDFDQHMLKAILPFVPAGGTVIDVGAFIGDTTLALANAVGQTGQVIAMEPHPAAFECLEFNMRNHRWVKCVNMGASSHGHGAGFDVNENAGANRLTTGSAVACVPLDYLGIRNVDFIKIDAEGFESKVLTGALGTLEDKPIMMIEVCDGHLRRQGSSAADLLARVSDLGYRYRNIHKGHPIGGPQFDILCEPINPVVGMVAYTTEYPIKTPEHAEMSTIS